MTTPMKRTPAWLIERVAQNELATAEVERIRARLAAEGRSLEVELAALRASNREILARLPGQAVGAAIRRRALPAVQPPPARRLRLPMLIAPAVLVGAVVLLVTRGEHGHFAGAKTHAPGVEEIVIKGDTPSSPRLLVYRQKPAKQSRAAGSVRLPSGARAARGDVLQLAYDKAPDRLYGVLLSIDGAGRVTLHLPEEGTPASATLTSLREMPLPSAYELDDAPDFERFMLITSTRPFAVDVALGAARALASQGSSARTLPLPLDPSYGQTSVLLLKISKGAP